MTTTPAFTRDPGVHSGDAVFPGTRVPIFILFDYLTCDQENGLQHFLEDYDHISREAVNAVLDRATHALVDEDLPPRLALALAAELGEAIGCSSVRDEGWRGLTNGELLTRMVERCFTILVTADRNLVHQQPLARLNLATVVVTRPVQRAAVFARVTAIAEAVRGVRPGASIQIPAPGSGRSRNAAPGAARQEPD